MSTRKKRILFVDDESLVLGGLQRMLRGMRDEWDIEFVDGGPSAFARMAEHPFDVVVSDMQMPGMDGATFLNEVMRRHPQTVRLVLSGHADRDLILRCIGTTHQYLAKPCRPELIKSTIVRATALQDNFRNKELLGLIARIGDLPSLPPLYQELVACLESETVSMDEVGSVIERDLAMTAKVLKIVNSAFFGMPRTISKPAEAACYLGADTLKSLVLLAHLFTSYEANSPHRHFAETVWAHSLQTASLAKALARAENLEEAQVNDAFVAGMLHDMGKLILDVNFPVAYPFARARMKTGSWTAAEVESEMFGATHAEVGGYLLSLWGLPTSIVQAVTLHHSFLPAMSGPFNVSAAVLVADALVQPEGSPGALNPRDLAALNLADRLPAWQQAAAQTLSLPHEPTPNSSTP